MIRAAARVGVAAEIPGAALGRAVATILAAAGPV